ncbi:hypothetical protein TNCV_1428391 [Trichonephila clavipes]|nr:hypothetical protein TNCV_1428391 [Trichonephila clavipes]
MNAELFLLSVYAIICLTLLSSHSPSFLKEKLKSTHNSTLVMATPFADQFMELRKTFNVWQVFGILIAAAFLGFVLLILKYAVLRRRLSQKLPGRKLRFFDILGNLTDMPLSQKKSHGWSFNVCEY